MSVIQIALDLTLDVEFGKELYSVPDLFLHMNDRRDVRCTECGFPSRLRVKSQPDQHHELCPAADRVWRYEPPVVVSYSGGAQSKFLAVRAIRGDFFDHPDPRLRLRPGRFAIAFADTGSEKAATYVEVAEMVERCIERGIPYLGARNTKKPPLHEYLIGLPGSDATRIDQPPLFVRKPDGKKGRLLNACTREWKIRPMRRAVRAWLAESGYPLAVRKWIGLAFDELNRVSEFVHDVQYERCEFPLIWMRVKKQGSRDWLAENGYTVPVRSLCAHCPNQSPAMFASLEGGDAEMAIAVDRAVRDLLDQGVLHPAYLSDTLIPVEDLIGRSAPENAGVDAERWYCASGRCGI